MSNPNKMMIASPEAVKAKVKQFDRRGEDIKSRIAGPLKGLWNPERELAQVTDLSVFTTLRERFPNFFEVIDLWEVTAIGLDKLGLPFESPPILLVGEPGLGKTYFANEAAKSLGLPYFEMSLATASAGFIISGGNLQWGEGAPGFIAMSLAESKTANPIILLDEIDKTHPGKFDPLGPLYPLLEPHSAKRFKDEALELELDASKINWIATANELNGIPQPIQSRMRICQIANPNSKQMVGVIQSVYQSLLSSKVFGHMLDSEIDQDVMGLLSDKSPREVRKSLDEASIRVIKAGRRRVLPVDLPNQSTKRSGYGFL